MTHRNKSIILIIMTVFLFMCFSTSVFAESEYPLLWDDADILTDEEEDVLYQKLTTISDRYDFDVVLITVYSLDGESAQGFADDVFDYLGYGRGADRSGILFLLSTEYRDWAFSTSGEGIIVFGDRDLDNLFNAMRSDLAGDFFYDAFETYTTEVNGILKYYHDTDGYSNSNYHGYYGEETESYEMAIGTKIIISLIVGLIAGLITTGTMKSKMKGIRQQYGADNYVDKDSINLSRKQDIYLYRNVSKTRRETSSSSSSHSSGSTHVSSSGRSHGGSSGKF